MFALVPKPITPAMIVAGTTVAEPAPGETLWVSGAAYAVGDKRIRLETHRVYECVQATPGRTVLPENDGAYWFDDEVPTQRMAPFDLYSTTASVVTGPQAFVIRPGFVNTLAIYGGSAAQYVITCRAGAGGQVLLQKTVAGRKSTGTFYGYCFWPWRTVDKYLLTGLPLHPDMEITIEAQAPAGVESKIGTIMVGDLRPLAGYLARFGGTEKGVSVEPISNSYVDWKKGGGVKIVRRPPATGLRASIVLPKENVDAAAALLRDLLDVPAAWIASMRADCAELNVFGIATSRVSYEGEFGKIDITVKGIYA